MNIVVVGAYGYTAQLICQLLNQNDFSFSVAGKNEIKLLELQTKFEKIEKVLLVDLKNENQVKKLVKDFSILINCAGPFTEESLLFVNAIAQTENKFYLDITGEIGFVKSSYEKLNATAQKNRTTLIHGCAYESLVADLAFTILEEKIKTVQEMKTFYSFQNSQPSPGTKMTMKLNKFRKTQKISEFNWCDINAETDRFEMKMPDDSFSVAVPYPLPEIAFSWWNYRPKKAMSYLLLSREEAMFVGATVANEVSIENELEKLKRRKTQGPTENERVKQKCKMIIQVTNTEGVIETLNLTGADMYLITARCILESLKRISEMKNHLYGVISPAKLFKGIELETLKKLGLTALEKE